MNLITVHSSGFINQYTTPGYFEWCTCGILSLAFQRNSVLHFSQEPQRPGPRILWRRTLSWRRPPPPSTTTRRSSSTPRWLKSRYGLVIIFLYLLPHTCKTLGHNSHHGNTVSHGCVKGTTGFGVCESHREMFTSSPQILWSLINAKWSFVWSHFFLLCIY